MRLKYTNIRTALAGVSFCLGVASAQAGPLLLENFNDVTRNSVASPCTTATALAAATPIALASIGCAQLPAGTTSSGTANVRRGDNAINNGTVVNTSFGSFFNTSASNNFLVLGDTSGVIGLAPEQGTFSVFFPFILPTGASADDTFRVFFDWAFNGTDTANAANVADIASAAIVGDSVLSLLSLSSDSALGTSGTFDQTYLVSALPTGNLSLQFKLIEHNNDNTNTAFGIDNIGVVPEPASIALLGIGLLGLLGARKQRSPSA